MAEKKIQKIAVVTGATNGIGAAVAHQLARERYKLVIPCRNAGRAAALRAEILLHTPSAATDFLHCNLDDLASVRKCAKTILERYPVIDLLICNAGVYDKKLRFSKQGIERMFAVNHLAHFVLVAWLLPNLYPRSRIVITSSSAHYRANPGFLEDINCKNGFKRLQIYANSKLANVTYAGSLAKLIGDRSIICNSVHPGLIATDMIRNASIILRMILPLLRGTVFKTVEEGGRQVLHLALSPETGEVSGKYFERLNEQAPLSVATDSAMQNRLWKVSLKLTRNYLPDNFEQSVRQQRGDRD